MARYHEFHRLWEAQRPPGEKTRNRLRWHIRVRRVEWWFHLYYYDVHICFLRSNCCIKMYLIMRFVVLSTVLVYIYSVCVSLQPTRRAPKVSELVVPTGKKRSSLQWEIR